MKKILYCLVLACLCGTMGACHQHGGATTVDETPYPIHISEQQQAYVNGNNAFTLNFIKAWNDADTTGKSFICSPLSITYVLSMVNDAAVGTTRQELERTLGFGDGNPLAVNDYCKLLIDSLPLVDQRVQLHIANAIFVNHEYQLKQPFLQDMQQYYDALAESHDFSSPKTLPRINGWCNEKTHGMIPSILKETDPIAVSYLLNAIYFKADWTHPFEETMTEQDTFATDNGPVMVPMMHQLEEFRYMNNDIFAAVELPYSNGQWNMTVMLPEEGKTTGDIINWLAQNGMIFSDQFRRHSIDLNLPRFETESALGCLKEILEVMGIAKAFNEDESEIPNMCNRNIYISKMLQQARIKVNESGSEAAAVTVTETSLSCYREPEPPIVFHADRPFVYLIREASTGVILFVGKYTGK